MEVLKKRQRFTDHDDLALLREVLSQNPFQNPGVWEVIQEHVFSVTGKPFSIRTLKEHLERLLKIWLEQYKILKDKSGIEIQITEKESLLHNIYDLMKEYKTVSAKKKKVGRDNATKVLGVEARNKWTELLEEPSTSSCNPTHGVIHDHGLLVSSSAFNIVPVDGVFEMDIQEKENIDIDIVEPSTSRQEASLPSAITPKKINLPQETSVQHIGTPTTFKSPKILGSVRSRKRKINTQRQGLAYLEQYDKVQGEIKKKEMDIEERKLVLEERKMQLMEKQHKLAEYKVTKQLELEEKKINLEIESREILFKIVERQDKLLNLVINKLT